MYCQAIRLLPGQEAGRIVAELELSKFADGKLIVVNGFDVKEPKSKLFRQALDALNVETTALLVEAGRDSNRNLTLSSRLTKHGELA